MGAVSQKVVCDEIVAVQNYEIAGEQGLLVTAISTIVHPAIPGHAHDDLDPDLGSQIEAGASLLNTPELTATVQLAKVFQLNGSPMQIVEDLLHVGDRPDHFGTDFELPSYNTARMFAAYDVTPNLEIRADVDKLLMRSFTWTHV